MKKLFVYGLTASLMAAFVFAGCKKDDDDDNGGGSGQSKPQKQLLSRLCEWTEDGVSYQTASEYKYDKNGNCTYEDVEEISDNTVYRQQLTEREYNSKGQRLKETYTNYHEGAVESTETTTYDYDGEGREILYDRKIVYADGKSNWNRTTNKYNDHGDRIEYAYSTDGYSSKDTYEYQYDAQGNVTEVETYYNGQLSGKSTYAYNGNVVNTEEYSYRDGNEIKTSVVVREYTDSNYKQLKSYKTSYLDENGEVASTSEWRFTYDSDGNQTGYEMYENEQLKMQQIEEGNSYTNIYYNYNGDEVTYTGITKQVWLDSNRDKTLTNEYTATGKNEWNNYSTKSEYSYDNEGNQVGYKYSRNGQIQQEYKEYVYDGSKVTYIGINYNESGAVTRTCYYTEIYSE